MRSVVCLRRRPELVERYVIAGNVLVKRFGIRIRGSTGCRLFHCVMLHLLNATTGSVAPRDTDGLLCAAMPGNRDSLGGAARRIGPCRGGDSRRTSMCPIPGNIIGASCVDIA